jgi:putative hydrolase of the HAD superfamily
VKDEEVFEIIRSLKGRRRLGLLSNTDVLHFNYILSKYPIVHIFDQWILSFEVGFKKPAVEIFRKAIEWASVEPQKILFIDDMKIHIEAALSLGMQAIHFISAGQLRKELNRELKSKGQD